jgi:hypothetical protein
VWGGQVPEPNAEPEQGRGVLRRLTLGRVCCVPASGAPARQRESVFQSIEAACQSSAVACPGPTFSGKTQVSPSSA